MSIILDLIVLLFISFVVWKSAKNGFLHSVIVLVGYVLMVLLLCTAPAEIAEFVYDKGISSGIDDAFDKEVEETTQIEQNISDIWDSLPSVITSTASQMGYTKRYVIKLYNNNPEKQQALNQIKLSVVRPVVISLIQVVITIILFIVCLFLVRMLAKLFKNIKIPIVGKLNNFLGGVLGLFKGFALSLVLVYIIAMILPPAEETLNFSTNQLIKNSHLFGFIYNFNFFSII